MKKLISALLCLAMLFSLSTTAFADGDPNIDGGGGGMGQGTGSNSWSPGRDGVRVTIIRDSDNTPVSSSVDFANGSNGDIKVHFGSVSKIAYRGGSLTPHNGAYHSVKPTTAMPRIVSSSGGNNIAAIRSYFTDKGTIQFIAAQTGFDYDKLVGGDYKLLLEPVAYV